MGGRELVFALAPEAGQGAVRKVEVEGLEERAPTPDPSPRLADARGGGEKAEQARGEKQGSGGGESSEIGERHQPSLMARVQELYEDTAVPVREIARLCGVTERTLYKYVAKGGWRRRYVRAPADDASTGAITGNLSGAERGERWLRARGHEPVKGAGGRFVPRAEAGRPVAQGIAQGIAHGIKALDSLARERAATACAAASARAAKARARADERQVWDARVAAINAVSAAMAAYNRFRASRATVRTPMEMTADEQMEAYFVDQIAAALDCVRKLKM